MQRIKGWLGVSILGLVLWTALPGYGQYTITNIAYAKLEVGYYPADTTTIYQVTGRIVSPSLATNKTLIYMVDTNDNSGIAVRLDSTVDPGTFAIGREAYARGLVQQTNGERYIYCQYAAWFAQTDPVAKTVAPVPLSIAAALANPEQYESSLVLFTNCTIAAGTWPAWQKSGALTVSDGTASMSLYIEWNTGVGGQLAPTNRFDLTCLFRQYDTTAAATNGYEVTPRFYADLAQTPYIGQQPLGITVAGSNLVKTAVGRTVAITVLGLCRNAEEPLLMDAPQMPATASFTDNGNRSGTLVWTVPADALGTTQSVVFTVTDDNTSASLTTTVQVVVAGPRGPTTWDFEDGYQGWTDYHRFSTNAWEWRTGTGADGSLGFMYANGYNKGAASDTWLISPALDLSTLLKPSLKFFAYRNYTGSNILVRMSTNYSGTGDPLAAGVTWSNLPYAVPATTLTWNNEGPIDVSAFVRSNVYLAFEYVTAGTNSNQAALWQVDEVSILGVDPTLASISITNLLSGATTVVPSGAGTIALSGTANSNAVGLLSWTNSAGSSGRQAAAQAWSIAAIPLAIGTNVITLAVSNAAGITAQDWVTVFRQSPGVAAPVILAATGVSSNRFTANWTAVPGAIGYWLDVATNPAFAVPAGGGGGSVYQTGFETGSKSSYAAGDVVINGVSWNLADALIGNLAGDKKNGAWSARLRNGGMTMNADTNMGLSSITFLYGGYGTDAAKAGRVDTSTDAGATWQSAGTFNVTSGQALTPFVATNLNLQGNVRVRIVMTDSTTARCNIDDLALYPFSLPTSAGDFVPGYQGLYVTAPGVVVNGLTLGSTYYYRAMATDGATNSAYSATTNVTTVASSSGPTNVPPLAIQSIGQSQGLWRVTCSAATGVIYRLEYTDSLATGVWSNVTDEVTATGASVTLQDTNAVGARFYRFRGRLP